MSSPQKVLFFKIASPARYQGIKYMGSWEAILLLLRGKKMREHEDMVIMDERGLG